ncbi:GPI mannosyltransferase 2 [Nosema granulosis]|uniref:GPI mannosyltransferase 2 n=1 Tax=Nosema granulosis TaxID=83296 RepID=A0A9P6H1W4_9MICR|nr:GPI mannosyltransferase 2 [Nosema granulosis]
MNKTINYKRLAFNSFLSRIFYISICTLSHYFIPHYDLSTNLNDSSSIFIPLLKWDAVHFRDISENGYLQEHTLAFFPLLPYITRTFHIIINSIFHIINSIFPFRTGIEVFTIGIILNNLIFIINSLLLYKLTLYVFDFNTAIITFYLYIFNPASIICSSLYTESLFMLLFLISLFFLIMKREVYCTIVLSLSVLCRSNGILFCILLYRFRWNLLHFIALCIPIGLHQLYCLSKILSERFAIFVPYSYVQNKYWNQGFLKYIRICHIEHILLNLPFILYVLYTFYDNSSIRRKLKDRGEKTGSTLCYQIFVSLELFLFLQTISTILFLYWSFYFRFISYNPVVYWTMARMYKKRSYIFKKYLRFYLFYSVRYALSFGAFYEPV